MAPEDWTIETDVLNEYIQEQAAKLGIEKKIPTIIGIREDREGILRVLDDDQLETCMNMQGYDPGLIFCLRIPANQEDLKRKAKAAGFKVEVEPVEET